MAFNQFKLDLAINQSRDIFNVYQYESDTDTIADVEVAGYFSDSRFVNSDVQWVGSKIECLCADGYVEGFVDDTGTFNAVAFNGVIAAPGANTQLIFNDLGILGADVNLTYVKGSGLLTTNLFRGNSYIINAGLNTITLDAQAGAGSSYIISYPVDPPIVNGSLFTVDIDGTVTYVDPTSISIGQTLYNTDFTFTGLTERMVTFEQDGSIEFITLNLTTSDFTTFGDLKIQTDQVFFGLGTGDGIGGLQDFSVIQIVPTDMLVVDTLNSTGLKNAADYSLNFTDRSLIDKAYSDLWSFYLSDATLDNVARSVTFDNDGQLQFVFYDTDEFSFTQSMTFFIDDFATFLRAVDSGSLVKEFRITHNQMLITDTQDSLGVLYAGDYSANFIDRSLIDKAYSDLYSFYLSDGTVDANRVVTIADNPGNGILFDGLGVADFAVSVTDGIITFNADGAGTGNVLWSIDQDNSTVVGENTHSFNLSSYNLLTTNYTLRTQLESNFDNIILRRDVGDGIGGVSSSQSIDLNGTQMAVEDTTNSKGLEYTQDYAANFTDLSIPNVLYVKDNVFTSSASFSVNTSTATEGRVLQYNCIDLAATRTLTISDSDVILFDQDYIWKFLVKDEDGSASNSTRLIIRGQTKSVTSVSDNGGFAQFNTSTDHNFSVGTMVYHSSNFTVNGYRGAYVVTSVPSSTSYVIGTLLFEGTATGTTQFAIDDQESFQITDAYESTYIYTNGVNIYSGLISGDLISNVSEDAASFSAIASTSSLGRAKLYQCTDRSVQRVLTISDSDILLFSPSNPWTFEVVDRTGSNSISNSILIQGEEKSVSSVTDGGGTARFTTALAHNYSIGSRIYHTGFGEPTYNGFYTITTIVSDTAYEIASIPYAVGDSGITKLSIDNGENAEINTAYASYEFYTDGQNIYTRQDVAETTPLIFGANSVTATTTTRYLFPGNANANAQTQVLQMQAPRSGLLRNLFVLQNTPAGNGEDIVYTVRVNGSTTALAVTIPSTTANASNQTDSVPVVKGWTIDIEVTKALGIGTSPSDIYATMEI